MVKETNGKRGFFLIALAAALIPFAQPAAAQNYKGPAKPTIQDYGPFASVQSKTTTATTPHAKLLAGNAVIRLAPACSTAATFSLIPFIRRPSPMAWPTRIRSWCPEPRTEPQPGFRSPCRRARIGK